MQHRYVGDIGDFSKFYMLRSLFSDKKIGINWYLYPNENHNSDGRYVDFSYDSDYGVSKVLNMLSSTNRNIYALEEQMQKIFRDITFYSKEVENPKRRREHREKWFKESLKFLKDREVAVVAPDNGIEVKSVTKGSKRAGKYIYYDEIKQLLELNNLDTLVLYQHYQRVKNFKEYIVSKVEQELRNELKYRNLYALSFHKLSPRVYIIISKNKLDKRIKDFVEKSSDWRF